MVVNVDRIDARFAVGNPRGLAGMQGADAKQLHSNQETTMGTRKTIFAFLLTLSMGTGAAQGQTIQVGETKQGQLRAISPSVPHRWWTVLNGREQLEDEHSVAGHPADFYRLTIRQTGWYIIDMRRIGNDNEGGLYDPYLILTDAQSRLHVITRDDDRGGNRNARIDVYLHPGDYFVVATSFSSRNSTNAYGFYSLKVQRAINMR